MKNRKIAFFAALLLALTLTIGEAAAQMAAPTKTPEAAPKGAASKMPAPASIYTWTKPITGLPTIPVMTKGVTYNLTWTGGHPGSVIIYLVNWCTWTAQLVITSSAPNTHSFSWTVPMSLPCGVYECYIQNTGTPVAWSYSQNFAVTKP